MQGSLCSLHVFNFLELTNDHSRRYIYLVDIYMYIDIYIDSIIPTYGIKKKNTLSAFANRKNK